MRSNNEHIGFIPLYTFVPEATTEYEYNCEELAHKADDDIVKAAQLVYAQACATDIEGMIVGALGQQMEGKALYSGLLAQGKKLKALKVANPTSLLHPLRLKKLESVLG